MNETLLDHAHAAMEQSPEDERLRLKFYERLAASELFLLLETPADDDSGSVSPQIAEWEGERFALVFDKEDRLAEFQGGEAPYIALSGRVIAGMLAAEAIGMGVNLDVAPSSILLPHQAVTWLVETLGNTPDETEGRISELCPPRGLPETLLEALDQVLATALGLARAAYLVGVVDDQGRKGHLLGFVGALPQAEGALAKAAGEALTFSGIEAGAMDVAFFAADHPICARLDRVGLRFDIPQPDDMAGTGPTAPGMNPEKPPRLR